MTFILACIGAMTVIVLLSAVVLLGLVRVMEKGEGK
jgi:hypothetical protein